jgi:hypothetical protein
MSLSLSDLSVSLCVSELMLNTLESIVEDAICNSLRLAGKRHNFDAEEEIDYAFIHVENIYAEDFAKHFFRKFSESFQNVTKLALNEAKTTRAREPKEKKTTEPKEKKTKEPKEPKEPKEKKTKEPKEKKKNIPIPYKPSNIDTNLCHGLAYNRGLFTQCLKKPIDGIAYCTTCQAEADKNANGYPNCGTIQQRLATGLYDFKDNKGRSPVSYLKVLENLKIPIEDAPNDIATEHLTPIATEKKNKGRPKKTNIVESNHVNDLFANLIAQQEEPEDSVVAEQEASVVAEQEASVVATATVSKSKKTKLTDEEKENKKKALETERANKKKEQEAKKKADAEAKKKAKEEEKAQKEAMKAQKTQTEAIKASEEAPKTVKVRSITIGDKEYKITTTNELYDPKTKELVGRYNPLTNTIEEIEEDDEDEEDEEEVGTEDEAEAEEEKYEN